MKRKDKRNTKYTEEEKPQITAYMVIRNVSKCFPSHEYLKDEFYLCHAELNDPDYVDRVNDSLIDAFESLTEKEIKSGVKKIKHGTRDYLYNLLDGNKKKFFVPKFKSAKYPMAFARPLPFFPTSKNDPTDLEKIVVREYGKTKISIKNTTCTSFDAQTYIALTHLCLKQNTEETRKGIKLWTTYKDIAKELRKINPSSKNQQEAIRNSISRLKSMCLKWQTSKGENERICKGRLIGKYSDLEPDSEGEIVIHLNKSFVDLMEKQFVKIEPIEKFFRLRNGKAINLLIFLQSQKTFNTKKGYYSSVKLGSHNFEKIYYAASLRSPLNAEIPRRQKKYEMKKALKELKESGFISDWEINSEGHLTVLKKGSFEEWKRKESKNNNRSKSKSNSIPQKVELTLAQKRNQRNKKLYLPIAKRLYQICYNKKRKLFRSKKQLMGWANSLRLMEETDKVSRREMNEALDWYDKNIGKPYVPEIDCGQSFRSKYGKLLNAIDRQTEEKKKPRIVDGIDLSKVETTYCPL